MVPGEEGVELRAGPGDDLGFLGADLVGGGWVDGALLLGGVDQDQPVIDRGVEKGGEQDVDLGDGVGRQRLAVAGLVAAAGGLELSVVGRDPGGREHVDTDRAEVGGEVVADDLLVAGDGGVLQPKPGDPMFGVLADGGGLDLEASVGLLLPQGLCEYSLCLLEALEAAAGDAGVAVLGSLGVLGDIDLELPTLAAPGCVGRDRSGVSGPRTPDRLPGPRLVGHVRPTRRRCRHEGRAGHRGRARGAGREQRRDVHGMRPSAARRSRGASGCPGRPRCTAS